MLRLENVLLRHTHTHSRTTNRNFGGNSPQVDAKRFSQFLSILSHSSGTFGRQRNKKKIQNDNERFFKVTFIFPIRKFCKRQRKKNIYFCSEFRRHNKIGSGSASSSNNNNNTHTKTNECTNTKRSKPALLTCKSSLTAHSALHTTRALSALYRISHRSRSVNKSKMYWWICCEGDAEAGGRKRK